RSVGIPITVSEWVGDADAARVAAARVGYPVALKVASSTIVHKSDVGGVVLGLTSDAEVDEAFTEMAARLGDAMHGAFVQRMEPPGLEVIVGVTQDPLF